MAVIGGGPAGIACACRLADSGAEVVLFEAKRRLGGRMFSFRDPVSGAIIDNCKHVILGCCSRALALLEKLGSLDEVEFADRIQLVMPDAGRLEIAASALPAPLHLLPSLVRTGCLSRAEKAGLIRGLARTTPNRPRKGENAQAYVTRMFGSEGAVAKLIEPVLTSALNEPIEQASAEYARTVILEAFVRSRRGWRLGVPRVPLSELIAQPAERYLRERGCEIRFSAPVARILFGGGRASELVTAFGKRFAFDAFVCAVPPWSLAGLGVKTRGRERLVWRSIVGANLFFDAAPCGCDHACVVGEPFGWVFNNSARAPEDKLQIEAVASAADEIVNLPERALVNMALRSVARAAPELAGLCPSRRLICRTRRATFATSGCDMDRPACKTHTPNLFLAGDWTNTRWPATIESAVRSGETAAHAALAY